MATCVVELCTKPIIARGLCTYHYQQFDGHPDFKQKYPTKADSRPKQCIEDGCGKKVQSNGLCKSHYAKQQWIKHGNKGRAHNRKYYAENRERLKEECRKYGRSVEGRYSDLKNKRCDRDNIPLNITLEEYRNIVSNPCHYCGGPLPPQGTGLDRKDNSKGYDPSNVVPCCWPCNDTRRHRISYEEMIALVEFRRETQLADRLIGGC